MDVSSVLVWAEQDGAHVGVVKGTDGHLSLSSSRDRAEGPRLSDYRPSRLGLDEDRTAVGGRLPPGAASAEVIDDAGERHIATAANGAYVAVLDDPMVHSGSPVCCRAEDGALVALPLPSSWQRTPVSDAEEPCPACGALAWDEVQPTDHSRGTRRAHDGAMEPAPLVVCRACGHEESVGAWATMQAVASTRPGAADAVAIERALRTREKARRRRLGELLLKVRFQIYVPEGYPATLAGHSAGSSDDDPEMHIEEVDIAHDSMQPGAPTLRVKTALNSNWQSSERAQAANELAGMVRLQPRPPDPERSEAARALALHAAARKRRELVMRAERGERLLHVDGRPARFAVLSLGSLWVAVHRMAQVTIMVSGEGTDLDSVRLVPIADPVELT